MIKQQLTNHKRSAVLVAYNYVEYLPQRRRMMDEWATYLDELREKAKKTKI